MNSKDKVLSIFNKIFWIIVVIIFMNEIYNFIEPKLTGLYKDNNIVLDSNILNELTDCSTKYFDSINYKQYEKSNMLNAYLNRKTYDEYGKIYTKINTNNDYKIIVKYAYKLMNETYRCYILVQNLDDDNNKFINNNDKSTMYEIVIKLNLENSTFKVLSDKFN